MSQQSDNSDLIADLERRHGAIVATLHNGLRIIIMEDHRTPLAICHVWVRVGSNREPDHLRGWAHGIEHMLFKGTAKRAERDFALEVAAAGGSTNAGTGYETTSYHILLPKENLHRACDILADAMFSAAFTPAALDAEREVLVHENHMYDDQPSGFGVTWRWGMELAFDHSPYRHPIGGRDQELRDAPRHAIFDFYRAAYRPDNMTAVIVGDVTAGEVFDMMRDSFARPAGGTGPELPQPPIEPPQTKMRYRLERGDLQHAYAKLIFHGPSEKDPDRPTLSVIRRILSDGRSCRLYRIVQEQKQLVSDITVLTETGPREGVILVDLETDAERLLDAVVASAEILEDLKSDPPTAGEIDRAKIRVQRSFLLGAATVQGQASNIGYYEVMDDLDGAFCYPERVATVSAEDVTRVCRQIFQLQNLTVVLYVPQRDRAETFPDADALEAALGPVLSNLTAPAVRTDDDGDGIREKTAAATRAGTGRAVARKQPRSTLFEQMRLPGGLPLHYRIDRSQPLLSLAVYATGGAAHDTAELAGLAYLTHQVQVKGTAQSDAETIYNAIESRGASLAPHIDRDYAGLFLTALSEHVDPVLAQLGDLICQPGFPANELAQERRLALAELQAIEDDPFRLAARQLRETLYGDHPYGRPIIGLETTLPVLSRQRLIDHYRRFWVADDLLIVASGDLEPDRLATRLEAALSRLPQGDSPRRPDLALATRAGGVIRRRLTRDIHQSVIFVGWPGQASPGENRVEMMLLKELLNGQSGRLFAALRDQRSLCYHTGLINVSGFGPGLVAAYVMTDPESEQEALDQLLVELEKISRQEISPAEFERARAKLIGGLLIENQTNSARAMQCARDILYGRGPNSLDGLLSDIRACPPEAVQKAAACYIDPDNRVEIILAGKR